MPDYPTLYNSDGAPTLILGHGIPLRRIVRVLEADPSDLLDHITRRELIEEVAGGGRGEVWRRDVTDDQPSPIDEWWDADFPFRACKPGDTGAVAYTTTGLY